tara:strand:- start:48980 stop:49144 length:165 start_codon:yes stop_codon:yes gene_type:complete
MGKKVFTFLEVGEIRELAKRAFDRTGKYPEVLILSNNREVPYEDYIGLIPGASQ